jgi:hypothetical protein
MVVVAVNMLAAASNRSISSIIPVEVMDLTVRQAGKGLILALRGSHVFDISSSLLREECV